MSKEHKNIILIDNTKQPLPPGATGLTPDQFNAAFLPQGANNIMMGTSMAPTPLSAGGMNVNSMNQSSTLRLVSVSYFSPLFAL
jgi:hypothetical protein